DRGEAVPEVLRLHRRNHGALRAGLLQRASLETAHDESWRVGHLDAARAAQFPGDDGVLSRGGGAFFTALFTGCWWGDVFSGPLLFPSLSGRQSFPARSAMDDGSGDDGA